MEDKQIKPFYQIIAAQKESEDTGLYHCYGLQMMIGGEILARVEDISTRKEELERLAQLCNQLELSPVHFMDVIEDFIA